MLEEPATRCHKRSDKNRAPLRSAVSISNTSYEVARTGTGVSYALCATPSGPDTSLILLLSSNSLSYAALRIFLLFVARLADRLRWFQQLDEVPLVIPTTVSKDTKASLLVHLRDETLDFSGATCFPPVQGTTAAISYALHY